MPGPGEYEFKSTVADVRTTKLGTSKREAGKVKETPGPGAYGNSYRPFSSNAPGGRFARDNRISDTKDDKYKSNKIPGPGEYELSSEFTKNKGYSIGIRKKDLSEREKAKIPGPGAYDPNKILPIK